MQTFGMKLIATNDANPPAMVIGFGDSVRRGAMIELMPATEPGAAAGIVHAVSAWASATWRFGSMI